MANYSVLKAAVQAVVKTNGNQEITGANMQSTLISIINSLGTGYQFMGVATPSTSPGTPDYNVAYIGGAGTYANFGTSVTVPVGSIGVFKYNGSWTKEQIALFAGIDYAPTANSNKFVSSAGIKNADLQVEYETSRIPLTLYVNLFDPNEITEGYYVSDIDGQLLQNANYIATGFIPVNEETDYYRTQKFRIAWYDKDKVFISGINGGANIETSPTGAAYIRCSITTTSTFMIAESSTAISYVPYGTIKQAVLPKSIDEQIGVNLLNTNTFINGYLNQNGEIVSGSYKTSDFINVTAGQKYCISDEKNALTNTSYICYYNSQKTFVSSEISTSTNEKVVTIPSGCSYMRVSFYNVRTVHPQIELGEKRTNYVPYSVIGGYIPEVKDNTVYNEALVDGTLDGGAKILEKSITLENIGAITSKNLLDIQSDGVALGYYVSGTDGNLIANSGYNTSAFIRVESGNTYYLGKNGSALTARFGCYYDKTKRFVLGFDNSSSFTIPSGVFYLRFSVSTAEWAQNPHLNLGALGKYTHYQLVLSPSVVSALPAMSATGNGGSIKTAASLAVNGSLTNTDFPYYQAKGLAMSMSCFLTSIGTGVVIIGKGYTARSGEYIKINATTVEQIKCDLSGNESVVETSEHGLTISTFLRVSLFDIGEGQVTCLITTESGMFTKTLNWGYIGVNAPFVRTSVALTNVVLASASKDLKKPVWCFGDSYMSVSGDRWVGIAKNIGIFGYMIDAISGGSSSILFDDAKRAFFFGTPRFAVWGLGMNDGSDTNASTPASSWLTAIQGFVELCKQYGTTPILATIPNVPTINNEGKNAWVRASGHRFIDFASAVGANTYTSGVSNWYDGALSSDNIHPTALGAKMLASQVFVDFPEIMQL